MKNTIYISSAALIMGVSAFIYFQSPERGNGGTFKKSPETNDFSKYWYAGEAEITSYRLEQARYGELRDGNAVLVYVTEPFLAEVQVKADNPDKNSVTVLKLNATKNFLTGIYPYSIMTSTFFPVEGNSHALKVSASVQEWCGHVYAQINNRKKFELNSHSYFEGEADQNLSLEKHVLENELWTQLRIDPEKLPTGSLEMIPSLEYSRLMHKPLKAYKVQASLKKDADVSTYTVTYPELDRELAITFTSKFPFSVEGWTETYKNGAERLTTSAKKIKSIKSAYWTKNSNADVSLRDSLGLRP